MSAKLSKQLVRFTPAIGRCIARRALSSWVPPANRLHHRPLSKTGEPIAFHINDLQQAKRPLHKQSAPEQQEYDSDLVVVLDLDECLVHSQFIDPTAAQQYAHQLFRQRSTGAQAAVDSFYLTLPSGDGVHVNERPGLHEFLQKVTSRFETHIFTAAQPVYANPVLDRLDTGFAGRWFRGSCTPFRQSFTKDLRQIALGHRLDRTVLVDNNPISFLQPENGLWVDCFYDNGDDRVLENVYETLETLACPSVDVRTVLGPRMQEQQARYKQEQMRKKRRPVSATKAAAPSLVSVA